MKFVFFANTDWYLYNFRLSTALELKSHGHEVVMLSPPGEFGARFAMHGLRWVKLAMDRASLNPVREAATLLEVVQVLKRERPDLLHSFTVKCAVYGALAARLAKVPAVVNAVAGMGYVFTSDTLKAAVLRPIVKVLMRATLASGHSRLILQNPDDADAFIRSHMVPLWMPDPGNPRSVTLAEVEQWAGEGLVNWLGHVEDMPALMRSVDVMALPSYYREGVPKSLIEGAASGLALVTTDLPGCREVVTQHGIDGLRVEPRDAGALAERLALLDDDRPLLHRLGARARETALTHFDERRVIQETINVYDELLTQGVATPSVRYSEVSAR